MNTLPEGGATASTMNDTTSLKPDPFSELRGLMEKASNRPWSWTDDNGVACPPLQWRLAPGVLLADGTSGTPGGDSIDRANAALIVAAVNALPALLDERDRLHEGLRERGMRIFDIDPVTDALDALTEWKGYSDKFEARALSAEGEVEKLRDIVDRSAAYMSHQNDCCKISLRRGSCTCGMDLLDADIAAALARQALSQEIG